MPVSFPPGPDDAEITLVGTAAGTDAGAQPDALLDLPRGTVIGRYVVLDKIGSGGMGVVYAAYDPELDRKVAVKLLVAGPGSEGPSVGRTRLLREAQALAKLSHPNVVAIHDVGTMEDRVWIAMEFVEGQTFRVWRKARQRPWRDILRVLSAAGAGLAAAHQKGLLHRDFKPDNIMVGQDGRVRVMDFGLARADADGEGHNPVSLLYESAVRDATEATGSPASHSAALDSSEATRAGALLGTPAYLAPEIFRGDHWSAATDQFAFSVTLWEALYGERPFDGDNLLELATHVIEGTMRPPPRGASVPGWVRRVCLRGLHVEPARRFPTLHALLEALSKDPSRLQRRLVGSVVVAAIVTGGLAWQRVRNTRQLQACTAEAEAVDQAWNPARRERLGATIRGLGTRHADATALRVDALIERYASRWRSNREDVCRPPRDEDPPSLRVTQHHADEALRAAQLRCFDAGLDAMGTLVELLETGESAYLRNAVVTAIELPAPEACRDPERLWARTRHSDATDPERARAVAGDLISARVRIRTGQLDVAKAEAQRALAGAEAIEAPDQMAEARLVLGLHAQASGTLDEAETFLRGAYFEAVSVDRPETAWEAALALTQLHSVGRVSFELAASWLDHARALARQRRHEDAPARARLAEAAAALATEQAHYEEAETQLREAIQILTAEYGSAHPDVGLLYGHLSELYDDMGDFEAAEDAGQRALDLLEESLGATHPDNAQALFAMSTAAWKTGKGARALELARRALDIREQAFGPEHVSVAEALNSVGNAHTQLGQWAAADAAHQRALKIRTAVFGPDEPRVATSLVNLAEVAVHDGRAEAGIAYARRSLRIWQDKLGPEHGYCAYAHLVEAEGQIRAGRPAEALAAFERALEIRRAGSETAQQLAEPLTGVGQALLALDRVEEAIDPLEEAWAIRQRHPTDEFHAPDTPFMLARALWRMGDQARARELAREAASQYEKVSDARPDGVAAVRRWQDEHPDE